MICTGLCAAALMMVSAADGIVQIDSQHVRQSALRECAAQFPDDLAIQGGCRRNYESGAQSIQEIAVRHADKPAMQRALRQCLTRFSRGGTTDYAIAGGCARNQEQGLLEMMR